MNKGLEISALGRQLWGQEAAETPGNCRSRTKTPQTYLGKLGISVSCDCCNKSPQTGQLKTAEIDCLTVPEARGLRSRCWQGWLLLEAQRGNHAMPLTQFWVVAGNPWWPLSCRCNTPISAYTHSLLCVVFSFYKDNSHWILSSHYIQDVFILRSLIYYIYKGHISK